MDRGNVKITVDVTEQDGDIAKANDPFRVSKQRRKIQLVDEMNSTVTAPGAEDGFDVGVIEHLLKIGESIGVCAAIDKILFSNGIAGFCFKTPAFDLLNGGLDILLSDIAGGAGDADRVTSFQIRRDQQGLRRSFLLLRIIR